MALQTFTWNNGTNDNPVSLNAQQLANLVKLASKENIAKDVKGHITTSSGIISKYDKYVLNQSFENLVIHATEQPDSFTISASKTTINEGETTIIIVTGMATNSVDFTIEHTVTGISGIDENAVKAKMHMNGNVLVVDTPQENASWQDVVRVKAKPVYEEWDNSSTIRYVDVTVKAIALSGVQLVGNNTIPIGNTEEISVNLIPSNCTKSTGISYSNTLISDGSLPVIQPLVSNGKIYVTAPAEECNLTLTTNIHLFGDENTIAFYATKQFSVSIPRIIVEVTTDGTFSDITAAKPTITLQKIDNEGHNIGNSIALDYDNYATVSGSTIIYTYGGGNVAGDGSETYRVSIEKIRGYNLPTINDVTPNEVVTRINATYLVITPDIYLIYTDGTEQNYDSCTQNGVIQGKTPICIKVITADGEIYVEPIGPVERKYASSVSFNISSVSANQTDYLGVVNTQRIENILISTGLDVSDPDVFAIAYARSKRITIADVTMIGYIPSAGEAKTLINNGSKIDAIKGIAFNNYDTVKPIQQATSSNYSDGGNNAFLGIANTGAVRNISKTEVSYFNVLYTQI